MKMKKVKLPKAPGHISYTKLDFVRYCLDKVMREEMGITLPPPPPRGGNRRLEVHEPQGKTPISRRVLLELTDEQNAAFTEAYEIKRQIEESVHGGTQD